MSRADFEAGDDSALLGELYWCFLNNLPVPEWAATAFVDHYRRGKYGEIRSWDEVFGRPARYGTRRRIEREIDKEQQVKEEILRLQAEGKSLNEEEFSEIGRRLGVGGKTSVKKLWRSARIWAERMSQLYGRR